MLRSPYPRLRSRMVSAVGVTDSFHIVGCLYEGVVVFCRVAFECEYVGVGVVGGPTDLFQFRGVGVLSWPNPESRVETVDDGNE